MTDVLPVLQYTYFTLKVPGASMVPGDDGKYIYSPWITGYPLTRPPDLLAMLYAFCIWGV